MNGEIKSTSKMNNNNFESAIEALRRYASLERKVRNIQEAMRKEEFEKVFWQRKCKIYAPNRIEQHYNELDEALREAGLFTEKKV